MATTNIDDLILLCIDCGHTTPVPDLLRQGSDIAWPQHCTIDMRLTNLTDRDGNPADRGEP